MDWSLGIAALAFVVGYTIFAERGRKQRQGQEKPAVKETKRAGAKKKR